MEIKPSLKSTLKRLRLSGLLVTLGDRVVWAKKNGLDPQDFLELVLQDEIDRREQSGLNQRLGRAGFEEEQTLEGFDWDAKITFDRQLVRDLFGLSFLERRENVVFTGPVGVGKTFLAAALGHSVCRTRKNVLFIRGEVMLRQLRQSRGDNSTERLMRRLIAVDLLIIDDFGLRRLTPEQSSDVYELIVERHRKASTIVTSNRDIDEWISLFDDPLLAQSAIDRFANNAHQISMEGESYREKQGPGARCRQKKNSRKTD
jgi:DNA replication protein DnaC